MDVKRLKIQTWPQKFQQHIEEMFLSHFTFQESKLSVQFAESCLTFSYKNPYTIGD